MLYDIDYTDPETSRRCSSAHRLKNGVLNVPAPGESGGAAMILQSLVDYYEALAARGEIARPGWGKTKIAFALELDENGQSRARCAALPAPRRTGKTASRRWNLPAPIKRTDGIDVEFPVGQFVLPARDRRKGQAGARERTASRPRKSCICRCCRRSTTRSHRAICRFFDRWEPDNGRRTCAAACGQSSTTFLKGANLTCSCLTEKFPDEDDALCRAWQTHTTTASEGRRKDALPCDRRGGRALQELHPAIKECNWVLQSSGAALVSFNAERPFCSYEAGEEVT
jgi:CRISPR-associated protein Csd1